MSEIPKTDVKDIKPAIIENFKKIKPEKEMSIKELNDGVKNEFNKASERLKESDISRKNKENKYDKPLSELESKGKNNKDIQHKDIFETAKEYINDLKSKSEVADTINDKALDVTKLEKAPPEKVAKMREEFDDNRSKLRSEWERLNNKEWPKYDHDVYSKNGTLIRKKGDYYDAHHIHPLGLGGKNEASNLTPLDLNKHQEIHSADGSCTKLVNKIDGGKI